MFAQDPEITIARLQDRIHKLCPPLWPGHVNAPQPPHHVIAAMPEMARHAYWATNEVCFLNDLLFHISHGQEGQAAPPRALPEGDVRGATAEDKAFTPGETTFEIRPGWQSPKAAQAEGIDFTQQFEGKPFGRSQDLDTQLLTAARYTVRKFTEWSDAGGKPNPGLCMAIDQLERITTQYIPGKPTPEDSPAENMAVVEAFRTATIHNWETLHKPSTAMDVAKATTRMVFACEALLDRLNAPPRVAFQEGDFFDQLREAYCDGFRDRVRLHMEASVMTAWSTSESRKKAQVHLDPSKAPTFKGNTATDCTAKGPDDVQ